MNILITGSGGVIGKMLTSALSSQHRVIGLSRESTAAIQADLMALPEQEITTILETHGIDMIIHCAADLETRTAESFYLNSFGAQKLLAHPLGRKKRHLLIGSVTEYGPVPAMNVDRTTFIPLPDSYYGASKLLQTALTYFDRHEYQVNVQIMRLFSLIGPQVRLQSFVGHVLEQVIKGSGGVISLDSDMKMKDFLDVRDLATAVAALVNHPVKAFLYEIGSGVVTSFKDFLAVIFDVLRAHGKPLPKIDAAQHTVVYEPAANTAPFQRDYGWSPRYSLKESIEWCLHEKGYL